ncbi:hypothetical protein MHPYR_30123 [uncultured Mycobacterium sp.]|uniref:Uncharacterized protein n=1 Tax=uncultured Mycobacterium sp. TaxID=171292 RepID=A0A1Y5PBP8_9MYCO|nr:hypothetical protein MHPYR_30123 [uncultured Mycobacterium sp.]
MRGWAGDDFGAQFDTGTGLLRSCSIKHRLPSIVFSLEMSKSEIVMRLLSAEAKVLPADMRRRDTAGAPHVRNQ